MSFMILTEDDDRIEITGTREELEAELVKVGLVGPDTEKQYQTPLEFFKSNNIYFQAPTVETLSVEQIVNRWV